MLVPITRKITDNSDDTGFNFIFYCDICGEEWQSIIYRGSGNAGERESELIAAYERANQEAIQHFNRCPACGKVVCDNCFRILTEIDMCKECASGRN